LALALAAGCAPAPPPPPPLPADVRVVPPGPGVPREHARYSGRWIGRWDDQLDHVLVIELAAESGGATEIVAVYAWGVAPGLGVGHPGWQRVRGRILDGALRLDLTRVQATALYVMQPDGTLAGEYWRGSLVARVRMTRAGP
jgi:hypothetical protein